MPRKPKKSNKLIDILDDEVRGPKTIKALKKNKVPPENIDENGALRIDELSMTKLLRLEAEGRAAVSAIQNMQMNLLKITQQLDPNGLISNQQNHIRAQESSRKAFEDEYLALKKRIGEKLGIDLDHVSYDDTTGVIFALPNSEEDAKAMKK